jgi:putative copper resistance protein D
MNIFIHIIPEWLQLISLIFCTGALVFRLLVFTPSAGTDVASREYILASIWRLFGIFLVVMVAGSLTGLLMRASDMSGQPVSAVFPVLPTVIFRTHFGKVWIIRILSLVLLSVTFKAGRRYRDSYGFLLPMLVFVIIISMTDSASGHASDKGDFSIAEIMDWLHLFAASVWGGGLAVLSVSLLPKLVRTGDQAAPVIAGVAGRFSKMAGIAVGIVALTSIYNAWAYVGSVGAFFKSPYGLAVLVKIILFLILINLGAFNRYINVPLLQQWGGFPQGDQGIVKRMVNRFVPQLLRDQGGYKIALRFKRMVRVEALLIIGVLFCAAMLRHEIPARHAAHMQHQEGNGHSMQHDGGASNSYSVHPNHEGAQ